MRARSLIGIQRGFTLAELLCVVAIAGILASVTVPSIVKQLPHYRLRSATSYMSWALRNLRMQAVAQKHRIVVTFPAAGAVNQHVYTVWVDKNDNGVNDLNESQTKDLRTSYAGVQMTATANPTFFPTGLVTNPPTLTLASAAGTKTITLNATGHSTTN